jgi:hypothetical protein
VIRLILGYGDAAIIYVITLEIGMISARIIDRIQFRTEIMGLN